MAFARLKNFAEVVLLFLALFALVPIPAGEGFTTIPAAAFAATICFTISRALRWNSQWYFALAEAVAFYIFATLLLDTEVIQRVIVAPVG